MQDVKRLDREGNSNNHNETFPASPSQTCCQVGTVIAIAWRRDDITQMQATRAIILWKFPRLELC